MQDNSNPNKFHDIPSDILKPPAYFNREACLFFRAGMNYRQALHRLEHGSGVIIEGSYSTAIAFYS